MIAAVVVVLYVSHYNRRVCSVLVKMTGSVKRKKMVRLMDCDDNFLAEGLGYEDERKISVTVDV